ncbi:hypothetical protein FRB99_005710 [Tulasnella sp. 403]|nr:hypothetical protein FRB99_005710 [Tulasnella sp. 403]
MTGKHQRSRSLRAQRDSSREPPEGRVETLKYDLPPSPTHPTHRPHRSLSPQHPSRPQGGPILSNPALSVTIPTKVDLEKLRKLKRDLMDNQYPYYRPDPKALEAVRLATSSLVSAVLPALPSKDTSDLGQMLLAPDLKPVGGAQQAPLEPKLPNRKPSPNDLDHSMAVDSPSTGQFSERPIKFESGPPSPESRNLPPRLQRVSRTSASYPSPPLPSPNNSQNMLSPPITGRSSHPSSQVDAMEVDRVLLAMSPERDAQDRDSFYGSRGRPDSLRSRFSDYDSGHYEDSYGSRRDRDWDDSRSARRDDPRPGPFLLDRLSDPQDMFSARGRPDALPNDRGDPAPRSSISQSDDSRYPIVDDMKPYADKHEKSEISYPDDGYRRIPDLARRMSNSQSLDFDLLRNFRIPSTTADSRSLPNDDRSRPRVPAIETGKGPISAESTGTRSLKGRSPSPYSPSMRRGPEAFSPHDDRGSRFRGRSASQTRQDSSSAKPYYGIPRSETYRDRAPSSSRPYVPTDRSSNFVPYGPHYIPRGDNNYRPSSPTSRTSRENNYRTYSPPPPSPDNPSYPARDGYRPVSPPHLPSRGRAREGGNRQASPSGSFRTKPYEEAGRGEPVRNNGYRPQYTSPRAESSGRSQRDRAKSYEVNASHNSSQNHSVIDDGSKRGAPRHVSPEINWGAGDPAKFSPKPTDDHHAPGRELMTGGPNGYPPPSESFHGRAPLSTSPTVGNIKVEPGLDEPPSTKSETVEIPDQTRQNPALSRPTAQRNGQSTTAFPPFGLPMAQDLTISTDSPVALAYSDPRSAGEPLPVLQRTGNGMAGSTTPSKASLLSDPMSQAKTVIESTPVNETRRTSADSFSALPRPDLSRPSQRDELAGDRRNPWNRQSMPEPSNERREYDPSRPIGQRPYTRIVPREEWQRQQRPHDNRYPPPIADRASAAPHTYPYNRPGRSPSPRSSTFQRGPYAEDTRGVKRPRQASMDMDTKRAAPPPGWRDRDPYAYDPRDSAPSPLSTRMDPPYPYEQDHRYRDHDSSRDMSREPVNRYGRNGGPPPSPQYTGGRYGPGGTWPNGSRDFRK